MMMLAILTMLIGAVLGLRFEIIILFPTIVIGSAAAFAFGVARSDSFWPVLLTIGVAITMLQIGYLGGALIRFGIVGTRQKGFALRLPRWHNGQL